MGGIIPQCDIWQGSSGLWYVGYVKSFPKNIDNWMIEVRALDMEPAQWLEWIIEKYPPDKINIRSDCHFVSVAWANRAKANAYKLYINKILRNKKFTI